MIASSLFHFIKTLTKIISGSKFRASYNIEDVSDFYPNERYVAIPMVCFCDIPLKFISEHPMVYGDYGIGLKKEWGIGKGINPILYRASSQINSYNEEIIKATQYSPSSSNIVIFSQTVIKDNILRLSNYSKKYEADGIVNYLDREWRFVPPIAEMPLLKTRSQRERDKINRNYFNRDPDYISFNLNEIEYIIVPNKKEVMRLIDSIQTLKMNDRDKFHFCQLIIDLNSVKKDF